MNKNLNLVNEIYRTCYFPLPELGLNQRLSDMDIIIRQSILMEEGSVLFKALKHGDMAEILAALVNLGYEALGSIAMQQADVTEEAVSWCHDGYVTSIMRLVSGKINCCSSGDMT